MITLQRNFWIVVGLLFASAVAAAIWGDPIYYRLLYLWLLIIIVSYVWTALSIRGIGFKRLARTQRQQVGQIFEERFEISNPNRWFRLWIAIRDRADIPGAGGSRLLTVIPPRQDRSYLAYTWLNRRGLFTLGPTTVESGDLFGIFKAEKEFQNSHSLLVTPYLAELQSFASPPGMLSGGRVLHRKSLEATPHAAGVREYVPGDPLNRIHWPTTARRNQIMVKEYEQDPQADVWIFIDAQKNVQAALPEYLASITEPQERFWLWRQRPDESTLPPATIEYSVSIAASISHFFLRQGRAVGLVSAGQSYNVIPAERGERQLGKILETLAFIQGEGHLPLLGVTSLQASHLPRGSTVVLITPSIMQGVVASADDIEHRNFHPIAVLLDAASFGGLGGSKEILNQLRERKFQTFFVSNGDDLKSVLESGPRGPQSLPDWWIKSEEFIST